MSRGNKRSRSIGEGGGEEGEIGSRGALAEGHGQESRRVVRGSAAGQVFDKRKARAMAFAVCVPAPLFVGIAMDFDGSRLSLIHI
eukprot:3009537-Alexandrium_andersonii.AAC.1